MYRRALIRLSITCVAVMTAFILVSLAVAAQPTTPPGQAKKLPSSPPDYNPYPPGILPADLESELERVRGEVNFIFQQALAEFRALPPPNLTGQPPILQGSGYRMVQTLGKLMNFDETISPSRI